MVAAGLAISWWSLYSLARGYGMPSVLAAVVSTVFDGAALVLGDIAHRYALLGDSGAIPRALMVTMIGASGWLNLAHAQMLRYTLPGQVLLASPAAVAGALFEVHQRYVHRDTLHRHGRVAPGLPVFGRWSWILHPGRTMRRVVDITASRVASVPVTIMDLDVTVTPRDTTDTWGATDPDTPRHIDTTPPAPSLAAPTPRGTRGVIEPTAITTPTPPPAGSDIDRDTAIAELRHVIDTTGVAPTMAEVAETYGRGRTWAGEVRRAAMGPAGGLRSVADSDA